MVLFVSGVSDEGTQRGVAAQKHIVIGIDKKITQALNTMQHRFNGQRIECWQLIDGVLK